jgi:hypothetical protein
MYDIDVPVRSRSYVKDLDATVTGSCGQFAADVLGEDADLVPAASHYPRQLVDIKPGTREQVIVGDGMQDAHVQDTR